MVNIILMVLLVGVIGLLIIAAMQPADFRISRSGVVSAPPSAVFPHVNNLHNWDAWSPWAKLDPHAQNFFEGPAEGAGAKMSWSGNNKVGTGSMTLMESRPHEFIQFKLEFQKPMQATNIAEFTFKPDGDKTIINWSMYGTNNFMGKLIGLVLNCDKMVGGQFELGIESLKKVVELDNKSS